MRNPLERKVLIGSIVEKVSFCSMKLIQFVDFDLKQLEATFEINIKTFLNLLQKPGEIPGIFFLFLATTLISVECWGKQKFTKSNHIVTEYYILFTKF